MFFGLKFLSKPSYPLSPRYATSCGSFGLTPCHREEIKEIKEPTIPQHASFVHRRLTYILDSKQCGYLNILS